MSSGAPDDQGRAFQVFSPGSNSKGCSYRQKLLGSVPGRASAGVVLGQRTQEVSDAIVAEPSGMLKGWHSFLKACAD